MKTPKTDQLRVRLTIRQRKKLEALAQLRGRNENISDVVRDVIDKIDLNDVVNSQTVLQREAERLAELRDFIFKIPARVENLADFQYYVLEFIESAYRITRSLIPQTDLTGQVPSPAEALGRADSVSADAPPPSVKNQQKGTP